MTQELELKWISSFWRRIGALFIDTLLLGIFGYIIGLALESTFVQLGGWGRLVGFTIALVYFGIMNSSIAGGQTLGKKALKIRVVDFSNTPIGIGRSALRYIILATPFSLNGAQFSNEAMFSNLIYPLSFIIFGGLFSIIYLYLFNRITRQSLHDLAVGTFVVNAGAEKQETGKVWNAHIIIIALLFVVAAIVPAFTTPLAQSKPFKEMLSVQSALLNEPNVTYATVTTNTTTFSSIKHDTKTTTYVSSQVFLESNNVSDTKLARQLAFIVFANYPEAINKDTIQIILTYGYDIGIASKWSSYTHNFDPDDFQSAE